MQVRRGYYFVHLFVFLFVFSVQAQDAGPPADDKTKSPDPSVKRITKKLTWTGCGIAKTAFMAELSKAYEKNYNINIALTSGGSTKGIQEVSERKQDMGGSCRFVLPEEEKQLGVRMEPVAWDAMVVMVNLQNPVEKLTLDQIRAIFTAKITNWKELGGADGVIRVYAREGKTSGGGRNMREFIFHNLDQEIFAYKELG